MTKAKPRSNGSKWPADLVERWPIDRLIPYARNARTHDGAQIAQIAAAIREWGWTMPVLVGDDGTIIAGHGRVLAARVLGLTECPVMVATGWTEAQKRAYGIADNKLALNAGWDEDLLKIELEDLRSSGYDLTPVGFSAEELAAICDVGAVGATDPDEVPEVATGPATARTGDLWSLGRRRLLCGDATSAEDTQKVLGGVSPHLMVTDPPYGVDYDPDWRNRADRANGKPYGASAIGLVMNDSRSDWSEAYALSPSDVAYVWVPAGPTQFEFWRTLSGSGFEIRMQVIWAKQQFPIGRGHYHVQHEGCLYAVRKGKTGHWQGDRTQSTLWQINKPVKSETGHSTQKPVECMKRPIENNSSRGQAVYDPFVGSGTTIIAAEMTGRVCHAIEIDPAYVDVAIKRWQAFTGQVAMLDGDGRTFDEIAEARAAAVATISDGGGALAAE